MRCRFRIKLRKPTFRLRSSAGTNCDVLPPIDGIADGGGSDAPARLKGPKFLPRSSIQREGVATPAA